MSNWIFEGKPVTSVQQNSYGFCYKITNTLTGRQYIGQKSFWSFAKKQKKESNWEKYWSSCNELKTDVKKIGEEHFTREILRFCTTKSELNYYETKYQFQYGVLESDRWYNNWISYKGRKL